MELNLESRKVTEYNCGNEYAECWVNAKDVKAFLQLFVDYGGYDFEGRIHRFLSYDIESMLIMTFVNLGVIEFYEDEHYWDVKAAEALAKLELL